MTYMCPMCHRHTDDIHIREIEVGRGNLLKVCIWCKTRQRYLTRVKAEAKIKVDWCKDGF